MIDRNIIWGKIGRMGKACLSKKYVEYYVWDIIDVMGQMRDLIRSQLVTPH